MASCRRAPSFRGWIHFAGRAYGCPHRAQSPRCTGCAAPDAARNGKESAARARTRSRRDPFRWKSAVLARLGAQGDGIRPHRRPARFRRSRRDGEDRRARAG